MDVFDLELCLIVIWNILPGGQEHLTFWGAEGQEEFMKEDNSEKKEKKEENEKNKINAVWMCRNLKASR